MTAMKEFLYQIKGKGEGGLGNWSWPPLFTGRVEAPDRKAAKALVEELYEREFPTRVLAKDLDSNMFLLSIKEIATDDHHTRRLFEVQTCKQCGRQFKMIEKYAVNAPGGGFEFCCRGCADEWNCANGNHLSEGFNLPVIYRITNKRTGMCYIGKTRQVFTLRWYQHFFQASETKFHKAVKGTPVTDWTFEVLEVVLITEEFRGKGTAEIDRFICSREKHYIAMYDSVQNGYNTVGGSSEPGPELFAEG